MGVSQLESRKHKKIAEKIAKIKGVEYHSDKGIDVPTKNQAIEVEVDPLAFGHARKQLAGTTKTPYLAVPFELKKEALEATKGTRFGVMVPTTRIIKRGRRRSS